MIAAPIHLAGERLLLDPGGVLIWPARALMAVADLHLEKGSAMAANGRLVPPWDTRATLDRLAFLVRHYRPQTLVALGDSFHDTNGAARMAARETSRLAALAQEVRFIWVLGNHDPSAPSGIAGVAAMEWRLGPFLFRHEADSPPPGAVEICGHHHPKASVPARGTQITRPCFIADQHRLMLPAFGAYAGGLDVSEPAISALFPRGGRVFLLGRERLFSFPVAGHKRAAASKQRAVP